MKRLVVCCDGTWQLPDQKWFGSSSPTNVARISERIANSDGAISQVVWYDQGVGTGDVLDRVRGGVTGYGLDESIARAYRFLVGNYVPGDEIFLFGFSRGAYTVRSLAGMIHKCGIVRRDKVVDYASVMDLYRDDQKFDALEPTQFREQFSVSMSVPLKFIGVWDTVGALGIPLTPFAKLNKRRYQFHNTDLSETIQYAYHALAIDERREPFSPTLWTSAPRPGQTLEQVWFPGTHSDVGGGFASRGLPEIALNWMIEKAKGAGLAFDSGIATAFPIQGDPTAGLNYLERGGFWNLLSADRPIGMLQDALDPSQSLNTAVLDRWDFEVSYRPANLYDYLARTKNPRALSVRPAAVSVLRRAANVLQRVARNRHRQTSIA
jgi:uncharacterized protein (DUF2235 family)